MLVTHWNERSTEWYEYHQEGENSGTEHSWN